VQFDELKKQSIAEFVSEKIIEMIRTKQLKPGDKLPPERELSAQLGISRPSLREALRALSIMNVIEIRQGDGIYITSLNPEELVQHLEFVFSLDNSSVIDLFEARMIIEPAIAKIAALKASDEDISYLKELGALSRKQTGHLDKFLEIDLKIHTKIVEIANNPFLSRINSSLTFLTRASRLQTGRIPGVMVQTVKDHDEIIHALGLRDPETAYIAMHHHLSNVKTSFIHNSEKLS
jgi:DNA-binding FadR family transcriptional regulator